MQSWPKVKLGQGGDSSNLAHTGHRKSYLVIICPNSHEKLTKVKFGQVQVGSNIAQNLSSNP